jgi:hypothetical protein
MLSFRFYSSLYYPILNSDNAVTILMIHYFKLPHDLYFWDQDRMGSLIPLIGQIPFKFLNLSAITSESIVHYIILILGYFSFAHFIKSHILKVIFAVIWFFPPLRLIDVIQLYYGIHYSLIAMACYLIDYSQKTTTQNNAAKLHFAFFCIVIILIAAVWTSDMALISSFLFIVTHLFFALKDKKLLSLGYLRISILYTVIGIATGFIFIRYAKSISVNKNDYTALGDVHSILETCRTFGKTLLDIFLFKANEPFTSLYSYLVLFIVTYVIIQVKKIRIDGANRKLLWFFALDGILLFAAILASKWTLLNGVPRRYFACTYISLAFGFLLLIDGLGLPDLKKKIVQTSLLITVFIGGLGALYNIKYIWPKTMKPRVESVKELEQLGEIGIIAEYWNSYINSCVNPEMIIATPHDTSWAVKNKEIVEDVFKQPTIYVIKDMWFDHFPDTMREFGRVLKKEGNEFRIGDSDLCEYQIINSR